MILENPPNLVFIGFDWCFVFSYLQKSGYISHKFSSPVLHNSLPQSQRSAVLDYIIRIFPCLFDLSDLSQISTEQSGEHHLFIRNPRLRSLEPFHGLFLPPFQPVQTARAPCFASAAVRPVPRYCGSARRPYPDKRNVPGYSGKAAGKSGHFVSDLQPFFI